MNKIRILAAAAGMMALAGCNNDSGIGMDVDAGSITIQASIGEMTKVSYRGDTTTFDKGDKILIYGWTGSKTTVPEQKVVDGVTNRFNGNVWVPAKQMRWKNATDKHYFLGIYPVPENLSSFTGADYTLSITDYKASDLLIATNLGGIKATDGPVNLTFDHVMAKLNVNLKFRSEYGGTPAVSSVKTTVKTAAKVNYLTKKVTAQGDGQDVSIPKINKPAPGYNVSYSSIQIPQTGVRSITITVGDTLFVYESSQDIPLIAGKFTTIDLMIGKDVVDMNTISVSEWEAAADLTGGVAVVQDPYNGHEYVDLGLPSGLKWATCNVGASKPEEYGDYFAWGDTVPYYKPGHAQDDLQTYGKDDKKKTDGYAWSTYKWCEGDYDALTKYCSKGDYGNNGFTDSKTTLVLEDDAASYNWGSPWRMPTNDDFEELIATKVNTTDYTWTWCDGSTTRYADTDVAGWQIVRNSTGATLFLPAAGYRFDTGLYNVGSYGSYWSSSLYTDNPCNASWCIYFYSNVCTSYFIYRYYGFSVRPVCP